MNMNNQQEPFLYHTEPTSPNTLQTLIIEKERLIVPIIFIPGVMGSNIKVKPSDTDTNTKKVWCLDNTTSLLGWALPKYGDAKARKIELDPDKTIVDERGKIIEASDSEVAHIKHKYDTQLLLLGKEKSHQKKVMRLKREKQQKIEAALKNNPENRLFGTRRERGWGTVGFFSYGKFLATLQKNLFEPKGNTLSALNKLTQAPLFTLDEGSKTTLIPEEEQIKHCNRFYFPVHAMGYNWLESNEDSAKALKELIEVRLPRYYQKRGKLYDKVILITHSMGGLVARFYTQALGGQAKVLGVIHGVQPSTGAVAAYTRMKRGTEVNTGFLGKFVGAITENVLGKDAAEMTAVCAQAPGPLQLLPTPEYGMGWLTITDPDGKVESYPKSEPYQEIYLAKDKWWCACEPHLINPLNTEHNLMQMQDDWDKYEGIIHDKVIKFNSAIANKYHPNTYAFFGIEDKEHNIKTEFLTYKTAHWTGRFEQGYQSSVKKPATDHIGAKNRLDLTELKDIRTVTASRHESNEEIMAPSHGNHPVNKGNISEIYQLQPADGDGDGTVPRCSGEIPIGSLQARMNLAIGHEPAYKNSTTQEFTLRAIVNILQQVKVDD